jgi:sulfur carrier protein ThiS
MKLYIQKTREHRVPTFSGTVITLLRKYGINPETVIVTKNGMLVTDDDKLNDTDTVEVLQVVSGG